MKLFNTPSLHITMRPVPSCKGDKFLCKVHSYWASSRFIHVMSMMIFLRRSKKEITSSCRVCAISRLCLFSCKVRNSKRNTWSGNKSGRKLQSRYSKADTVQTYLASLYLEMTSREDELQGAIGKHAHISHYPSVSIPFKKKRTPNVENFPRKQTKQKNRFSNQVFIQVIFFTMVDSPFHSSFSPSSWGRLARGSATAGFVCFHSRRWKHAACDCDRAGRSTAQHHVPSPTWKQTKITQSFPMSCTETTFHLDLAKLAVRQTNKLHVYSWYRKQLVQKTNEWDGVESPEFRFFLNLACAQLHIFAELLMALIISKQYAFRFKPMVKTRTSAASPKTADTASSLSAHWPSHQLATMPHRRVGCLQRCTVVSVQIPAWQWAAVVTDYHTVGIQHWDDFEHKDVAENLNAQKCTWCLVKLFNILQSKENFC